MSNVSVGTATFAVKRSRSAETVLSPTSNPVRSMALNFLSIVAWAVETRRPFSTPSERIMQRSPYSGAPPTSAPCMLQVSVKGSGSAGCSFSLDVAWSVPRFGKFRAVSSVEFTASTS